MKHKLCLLPLVLLWLVQCKDEKQIIPMENVIKHAQFTSRFVAPRDIDVWLPPGYEENPETRYPVIYMHDGQMLFDPANCWNKQAWEVDSVMTRLIDKGRVEPAIIVGIWSTHKRFLEYMPYRPLQKMTAEEQTDFYKIEHGRPLSDYYLSFIVSDLKPFIDTTYRVKTDRDNTYIIGSSMGALISAYAISLYPNIFGGAGCVSTHWPGHVDAETDVSAFLVDYFSENLPPAGDHKIYFDHGTKGLDARYEVPQNRMDEQMKAKGYVQGKDWMTRKFKGHDHNEVFWRQRVAVPLEFFLGKVSG